MIVYGDLCFDASAKHLVSTLEARLSGGFDDELDHYRGILIRAGQLEQAVADSACNQHKRQLTEHITDLAAGAFYASYADRNEALPKPEWNVADCCALLREALAREFSSRILKVKVPEGFEFYTLFPEQYCHASLAWSECQESACDRSVLIVGIRSIGTSLSAVVATSLAAAKWEARRMTVRSGENAAELATSLRNTSRVIIVDEGPGRSGLSFRAVADAFLQLGFSERNISLFPSHLGEPGAASSQQTLDWWRSVPRFVTPLSDLRWNGLELSESLAKRSAALCNGDSLGRIYDLSAGEWRRHVFVREANWPAVAASFERTKYLYRGKNGSVLWKFNGLGLENTSHYLTTEEVMSTMAEQGAQHLMQSPLDAFRGFVAFRWMDGAPLNSTAFFQRLEDLIADYLIPISDPPLSSDEHIVSISRLTHMLYWNTKKALGNSFAEAGVRLASAAKKVCGQRTYSDGHLAPHEWIRASDGRIWKTDFFGHDRDHTIIGKQSILWDIAGVVIEWGLQSATITSLCAAFRKRGVTIEHKALQFYCAAYAAFRLGMFSMCNSADGPEQKRTEVAKRFYRELLRDTLCREN